MDQPAGCAMFTKINGDQGHGVDQASVSISGVGSGSKRKLRRNRAAPCPPRADRSVVSGSWSLEWLSDQHHSEAGVVSSSTQVVKKGVRPKDCFAKVDASVQKRKKVDGLLCHSVHSLKKVARLPIKNQAAVMQILKKNVREYQGSTKLKKVVRMISKELFEDTSSSSSANNDWKH